MEYEIICKRRLTKFTKIFITVTIALILLVTAIVLFSIEKFYGPQENENYKIAKTTPNSKKKINSLKNNSKIIFADMKDQNQEEKEIFIDETDEPEVKDAFSEISETNDTHQEDNSQELNIAEEELKIEDPEIVFQRDLRQFSDKKLVAFTFDDGPSNETTNKLLDNLDQYNARVTFFVVGSRVGANADALKRAYDMGNQIGSHTYSHKNLFKLDDSQIMEEVQRTNSTIKNIIGIEPTIIRPPYGNTNSEIRSIANMYTILWDLDTEDWKYRDTDKIVEYILNNVHDGAIILLHDLYDTSIDGALKAMEILEQEGYAFVTIDEMIELKNVSLNKDENYYYFDN